MKRVVRASSAIGDFFFATREQADAGMEVLTGKDRRIARGSAYGLEEVDVDDDVVLETPQSIARLASKENREYLEWMDQACSLSPVLSSSSPTTLLDEYLRTAGYTPRSNNTSSSLTQSSPQQASSQPSTSSGPTGCLIPLLIGFSTRILSVVAMVNL